MLIMQVRDFNFTWSDCISDIYCQNRLFPTSVSCLRAMYFGGAVLGGEKCGELNVSPHFVSDALARRLCARGFSNGIMTVLKTSDCYQFFLLRVPSFKT